MYDDLSTFGRGALAGVLADGRLVVFMDNKFKNEPIQVTAALLGHEVIFHQDVERGQIEEGLATLSQVKAWKSFVLNDPSLASLGTPGSKGLNLFALMSLNSGGFNFPNPGYTQAAGVTNILPRNIAKAFPSMQAFFETVVYPEEATDPLQGTPKADTPGNVAFNAFLTEITGSPQTGVNFDANGLSIADAADTFPNQEDFRFLGILGLIPNEPVQ